MSAIEECIAYCKGEGWDVVADKAESELTQLRARIAELEGEVNERHAKLVEVADKLRIERTCAKVDRDLCEAQKKLIAELESNFSSACDVGRRSEVRVNQLLTETSSLTAQVEALTAERDQLREVAAQMKHRTEILPPALRADISVLDSWVKVFDRVPPGGPVGGGPER